MGAEAKAGIDQGNPSVAEVLFSSYGDEARRTHRFDLKRLAAMKAREMAGLLKHHDPTDLARLPNPSNDPPPVWQVGKGGRGDPIQYMTLNAHQQWAVAEIRAIYSATVKLLMPTMKPLDTPRIDRSREPPNPLKFLVTFRSERLKRYFDWCKAQRRGLMFKRKGKRIISGLTTIDLVMAVLIDDYKLREIGRIWGLHPETTKRAFRQALNRY